MGKKSIVKARNMSKVVPAPKNRIVKKTSKRLLAAPMRKGKWEGLVQKSLEYARFDSIAFSEVEGNVFPKGWISSDSYEQPKELYKIVALDCEMCVVESSDGKFKNSKALVRVSVVDGEDPTKVLYDSIVKQPEAGFRVLDYKTNIHSIAPDTIENALTSVSMVQKKLQQIIGKDTIVVGHSVFGDLASCRLVHYRVLDTAMIYTRKGDDTKLKMPGLKDLASSILEVDMPDSHDSVFDAQMTMQAAHHALKRKANLDVVRVETQRQRTFHQLRAHRIPPHLKEQDLEELITQKTFVVPFMVEAIRRKNDVPNGRGSFGASSVIFKSSDHATLAFNTIPSAVFQDSKGREEKRIKFDKSYISIGKPE